jgi:hypothetical protein
MSLIKLSLAENNYIFPLQVTSRLGTGKSLTFFYGVSICTAERRELANEQVKIQGTIAEKCPRDKRKKNKKK